MHIHLTKTTKISKPLSFFSPSAYTSAKDVADVPVLQATTKTKTPLLNT